jgi:hypothetical protein
MMLSCDAKISFQRMGRTAFDLALAAPRARLEEV